ncbi:MAG TPA: DNA repair protein RecO, partial [Alphaproteobacteria bacterium]|nr:DNA repair protein RecO [Alphaproteobacteria bacterium]
MEWAEEGIILATRPHGEAAAIIDVLTRDHGRHAGLVRGGNARRLRAVLEPGNQVHVRWRARLADHLGTFTVEPVSNRAAALIGNP